MDNRKNGKKEGPVEIYYENKQLKEVGYYVNNLKDGSFEYYSENGELKEKASFELGRRK